MNIMGILWFGSFFVERVLYLLYSVFFIEELLNYDVFMMFILFFSVKDLLWYEINLGNY